MQWVIDDLVTFWHQLREIAQKVVWKYYELWAHSVKYMDLVCENEVDNPPM